VVAQQHQRVVGAEVLHQPLALVEVQGDALIVVVGEPRQHDQ
jgi:class 3 adenylate cyclase